jgi:hypothetical protein
MAMASPPMVNRRCWRRIGRRRQPQRNSGIGAGSAALGERRAGKRNTDPNSKDCRGQLFTMYSRTRAAKPRYLKQASCKSLRRRRISIRRRVAER